MKKKISVLALASMFVAGSAMASGWRIPEQSVDSTAKAGANIASSTRADIAYYNPANMAWMEDTWHVQLDATYIYLSEIDYDDSRSSSLNGYYYNGNTEAENFFVPTGFVVTPSYEGLRFGLSVTAPDGLAKRWKDPYQKTFAEKFALEVVEVNPTAQYSFLDNKISLAAGPRLLYAHAHVRSEGNVMVAPGVSAPLGRDMKDNTVEYGWNVALAVKPVEKLNISTTYRSNVDLDFQDTAAKLNLFGNNVTADATVSIPAPAVWAISVAYDVLDSLNVELTWDKTFWSKYETLDFDFSSTAPLPNPFDEPQARDWKDTNTVRLGLTYALNDTLTLMGGFAYDETPAPAKNVGFELPDSNALLYSLGAQYKVDEHMDIGIAALYDYKLSRTVVSSTGTVDGEFTNASALLISVGMNYKF